MDIFYLISIIFFCYLIIFNSSNTEVFLTLREFTLCGLIDFS